MANNIPLNGIILSIKYTKFYCYELLQRLILLTIVFNIENNCSKTLHLFNTFLPKTMINNLYNLIFY